MNLVQCAHNDEMLDEGQPLGTGSSSLFIVELQNILLSSNANKRLVAGLLKITFGKPESDVVLRRTKDQFNRFNFMP